MTAITFNLDDSLIEFIKHFSKEKGVTQKEVVEMSLKEVRKNNLRKEIIAEAKEIAEDKELQEESLWLAHSGLKEYNNSLRKIENEK